VEAMGVSGVIENLELELCIWKDVVRTWTRQNQEKDKPVGV